jgi:hypothetical protein
MSWSTLLINKLRRYVISKHASRFSLEERMKLSARFGIFSKVRRLQSVQCSVCSYPIPKDLMEENQQLRVLLRSISAFIGDGAGGLLERIGWTLSDFNNYVNKSETDTAWESYQRRKRNNPSTSPANQQAQKRPSEDDNLNPSRAKRPRGRSEQDGEHEDRFNLFGPMSSSSTTTAHLGVYPTSSARPPHDGNLFPPTSPIFTRSPTATNDSSPYGGAPSASGAQPYTPSYLPPINVNIDNPSPYSSANAHGSVQQQRPGDINPQEIPDDDDDDDDDSNKNDAFKLIRCAFTISFGFRGSTHVIVIT